MAQLWPVLVGLIVLLGSNINAAGAGTCRPAVCSQSGGNGIFKYQAGHTYTYNLVGKTTGDVPEQQGDPVTIELKAVAEVHFGAECTNTLKLRDIHVVGPNSKAYDLKQLEAHAVRFSFNDGQVEPEICSDAEDSNTALNMKRAVISLFQVSTPQSGGSATKHEVDVFGGCPTVFDISPNGAETVIVKTRNLNKCSFRENLRQRIPTSSYISDSELQNFPLLDANLRIDLKVQDGVLHSALSHEIYLYRPFSNKEAGAKTVVHTQLTFVSAAPSAPHPVVGDAPRSLIFDTPHGNSAAKSSAAAIVAAMQSCSTSETDTVSTTTTKEFRNLVEVFRSSNKNDLLTVYGQVKAGAGFADKVVARNLFLDALPQAGTGDTVEVIVELLKSKEIAEKYHPMWYKSLGFVIHATSTCLSSAASLLDAPNAPSDAYLAVGALVGRYCAEHNCQGSAQFAELITKLSKPLAGGCKCTSYEQENSVIAALRGLENAKGMNEVTAELVRVCMSDVTVPARVRVAALDTYKSDSCQSQLKKTALEILANRQEDSEIRIKAYLAVVECPCGKCANSIKEVLDSETVNQVGSFIVSHLRNLRASNNPEKALQKKHLSEIRTTNRFPFDVRKFSRNYEFSGLLDAFNLGSSAEANVIFSQQSYLPRFVSLNLTTELFGHSVNLLEIGTRAQNLDRLFESYFGPAGYVHSHETKDIFSEGAAKLDSIRAKLSERFKKTFRTKRSVSIKDLEAFRKTVYQPTARRAMDLDMKVKMFGNTLGISSYHGDGTEFSPEKMIDKLFDRMDDCVGNAKSFDYDIRPHTIFMEADLVYPTSLGFPLRMTTYGSAAARVKFNGKIDFQAIAKDPKNAKLEFEIVPSASVEVFGLMAVDAYAVEAGFKVTGVLHTSTGVNVNVKSIDGTGVDLTLGLPVKKQDLVNFKSEMMTMVKERGHVAQDTVMKFNTKRKDYEGCFDQLKSVLGLTFCGKVGLPVEGALSKAALFPLNGGSKLSIGLECNDVQSYKFRGAFNLNDPDRKSIEFLMDTPNSQTNRKVELIMEGVLKPNKELRIKLTSPIKSLMAELIKKNNQKEMSMMGRFVNDDQEYLIKLGADISGNDKHATYTPVFEFRTPDQKGKKGKKGSKEFSVEGSVVVDTEGDVRKFTFNGLSVVIPPGPLTLNGWAQIDKTSVSSDLKFVINPDNTVTLVGKATSLGPQNFKINCDIQVSQYPDIGASIDWAYNRGKDQLESTLKLVHGHDLKSTQSCLTAHILAKYIIENSKKFDISGVAEVSYPLVGVEGSIKGEAKPNSVSYHLAGKYDTYAVKSDAYAKTGVKQPGDYDVLFEAAASDNHFNFQTKRDIVSPTANKFYTKLDMKPGGKYELTTDTVCQYETNHVVQSIVAIALIEGKTDEYKIDYGLEASSVKFDGHVKFCIGTVDYVDLAATVSRGSTRTGNFKAMLKNHLEGAGMYTYTEGQGTLEGNLNFKKINRNVKAAGHLAVTGSNHVGTFDILFDEKDPSKKIHFGTVSDIQSNAVDTKNTLIILDYKTVFNMKGDLTGKLYDGHLKGNADLTLPNKRYITGSLDRVMHLRPVDAESSWTAEITDADKKGSPTRSILMKSKVEKANRDKGFFDADFNLLYKNTQGKDVTYKVLAKNLPDGDNRHVEFQGQVQGSLLDMAPMVHVKADISKPVVNYLVKVNLAADSNLELTGKCQSSADGSLPFVAENTLELNLPTGELKNVKFSETWTLIRGVKGAPCEVKVSSSATYNNANTATIEGELKASPESGQGKLTISLPKEDPRVIKGSYNIGKGPDIEREGSLHFTQGSKEGSVDIKIKIPQEKNSLHVSVNAKTPMENMKNFELVIDSVRKDKSVDSEIVVISDDKKVVVTGKYGLDWRNPVFQLGVVHPDGKSYIGFYSFRKEGPIQAYEAELKLEHNGKTGYTKADFVYISLQEFTATIDFDWPYLKFNQAHLVVASKAGVKGPGKTITVVQTEGGETTINGKLDYNFQDGSEGTLFEANGNLKVRGENRQAKILFKKDVLNLPSETGIEYTFKANLGDKVMENIVKQSTKETRLFAKGCEKKGSCGQAEFCSKYAIDGADFSNDVILDVDTTGLGYTTDFAFKRITQKKGTEFLHKAELTTKDKEQFLFKIEMNPKESSVVFVTPVREMAAEATYNLAFDNKNKNHVTYKCEMNAWLDKKREPNVKATFLANHDYLRTDDSIKVTSDAKFMHPSLGKDMIVKGKTILGGPSILDTFMEFDLFAKKGQKIVLNGKINKNEINLGYNVTSTWDVKSSGQNLDIVWESHAALSPDIIGCGSGLVYKDQKGVRDLGFFAEATVKRVTVFAKSPKDILVDITMSTEWKNNLPSAELYLNVAGCQAVVSKAAFEENKLTWTTYKKATPDRKIVGEIYGNLNKMESHVHLDWIIAGDKKMLYSMGCTWSEKNHFKVDYSADNMKDLVEYVRGDLKKFVDEVKTIATGLREEAGVELTDVADQFKKAQPNLKPLVTAYQTQLKAIKNEITSNKNIKELSDLIKKLVGSAASVFAQITEIAAKIVDKCIDIFEEFSKAIIGALKRIMPTATESCNKIFSSLVDIFNMLATLGLNALQSVLEVCKKYDPEIKQFLNAFAEIGHDFLRLSGKTIDNICREIKDIVNIVIDQVKALPMFSMLHEKIDEIIAQIKSFVPPTQIVHALQEITNGLKDTLPTSELRDFVECVSKYLERVLKNEKVDYVAEWKNIYEKGIAAVRSVITLFRGELGGKDGGTSLLGIVWPFSLKAVYRIPMWASVHLSPLKYLRSDDLPKWRDYIYTYWPRSWNPMLYMPPYKASGAVVDTSHFFTFDKRHFTFKPTCSVLLVEDMVNGNFSLVLNIEKGKFKTLQLSDGKDVIEITNSQTLLVNGKPTEYAWGTKSMSVWRRYHTINMNVVAGLRVQVDSDHHATFVYLDGCYHGQVRGLLGDANYEPFDDFRLPDGKICTDTAEFGNAYQIGGKCSPGTAVAHAHSHEAVCATMFSSNSPLRPAFDWVDPDSYREACDHLCAETSSKKQEYACRIAAAYVEVAQQNGRNIAIPAVCGQCEAPTKKFPVGEYESVKVPSQKADIVIVMEQVTNVADIYKDLVAPLVGSLTVDLKGKGITDVKFSMIGFGHPGQEWPAHHTVGGKIGFDGKAKIDFGDSLNHPVSWGATKEEKWNYLLRKFAVEVGITQISEAIKEASIYPFRAGAAKAFILVTGSSCESGLPIGFQKLRFLIAQKEMRDRGISMHFISPMEGFKIMGSKDNKVQKSVVGFDDTTVYSFADGKKKTLEGCGNEDLRKDVEYNRDICVDAALNTNGAAYNGANFLEAKSGQRKQFLQVVTNKLTSVLSEEMTEDCRCTLYKGLHPEAKCKITGRKESEALTESVGIKTTKKGDKKKPRA